MNYTPINLQEKFSKFTEHWSPKIVAQMNDYHFKLVKAQGEFIWHDHPDTDEVFIVVKGRMEIHFRDGVVALKEGEMFVVPKGIEHKPVVDNEVEILLVEPVGLVNTGGAEDSLMTAPNDVWI